MKAEHICLEYLKCAEKCSNTSPMRPANILSDLSFLFLRHVNIYNKIGIIKYSFSACFFLLIFIFEYACIVLHISLKSFVA